jgi:hypothetical protein
MRSGKNHLQATEATVNLQATRAILTIVAIPMILIWMIISTALAALSYAHGFVLYIVDVLSCCQRISFWTGPPGEIGAVVHLVVHFILWMILVLVYGRSLY